MDRNALLLLAQRALLYNLPDKVSTLSIEVVGNILNVLVYTGIELDEDEMDALHSFSGELCGDFVELEDSQVDVVVVKNSAQITRQLKYLIFARFEPTK